MASLLLLLYSKPETTDYLQKIVNPDFSPPATDRCWGRCPSPPCLWTRPRSWEHPCEVSKTSSPAYLARAARSPSSSCSAASALASYPPALLGRSPSLNCAYPLKRIMTNIAKSTTDLRLGCLPKKLPKPGQADLRTPCFDEMLKKSRRIERAVKSSSGTTAKDFIQKGPDISNISKTEVILIESASAKNGSKANYREVIAILS